MPAAALHNSALHCGLTPLPFCPAAAGYHVLSITTPNTLKTCLDNAPTYAKPLLFQQCTVTSTTYLSVYVDQYCGGEPARWAAPSAASPAGHPQSRGCAQLCMCASLTHKLCAAPLPSSAVKISPIKDSACSEPGATGYSYTNITIWGHYVKTDLIATRLDTTPSNLTRWGPELGWPGLDKVEARQG